MPKFYLINSVLVGTSRLWAGTVIDDALQLTAPITEAGGVLLDVAFYDLASAAELAQNAVLRGNPTSADAIMQAAVDKQPVKVEAQAAWYVDPTNGSDLGVGSTAATALKTVNEFFRRMSGKVATVAQTINLLGDCTAEGRIVCRGAFPLMVELHGQQTVRHTGTITGHVAYAHALPGPPVYGKITDSALTGQWSNESGVNLIDKCVILTSGTNVDSWAWLLRDDGSKTAVVGTWFNPHTQLEITPTNGDAYKVVDFTKLGSVLQGTTSKVCVEDCELVGASSIPSWEAYGDAEFVRCKFAGMNDGATTPLFGAGLPFFEGCFFLDGVEVGTSAYGTLYGSVLKNYPATISGNSTIIFDGPQTIGIRTGTGSSMELIIALAGYAVFLVGSGYGVITNGPANVIQLRPAAAALVLGSLWSLGGNSGQGIWCASGAQLFWNPVTADANTKFFFAGADHDAVIGETNKSIAQLSTTGFFNAANGAAVVPSRHFPSGP